MTTILDITRRALLAAALSAAAAGASAQAFPSKPIKFVVPFAAGSTTDLTARFLAQHVSERLKQPVVIENRAGANGFIGIQYALTQPADGYTVIISTSTTHAANAALFKKLPYDPVSDFIPLTGVSVGGLVLAVAPGFPAQNVKDVLELAKNRPGKLTFGSGNSSSRAGGELFKEIGKVELLHVPYKALPAAITDVIGGQVDMVFGDGPAVLPLVRSGRLKALGVSTRARMPGLDNVPTIAEQGLAGYELTGWIAAFAPKGTPTDIADRLNEVLVSVLRMPEAVRFFGETAWSPMPMSRQEMAAFQKTELARWARVIKSAGIEPE
ncbi:Bug family tripartite tricarboxylate transporter substrate binding protein [Ramlibacter sp.]|uniref:Bug family tripartite tricarboxylate transporter substrate binding protein n=1 Tax=Ramlibacter sp. TaxID=1917967 RepID=UPI003D101455